MKVPLSVALLLLGAAGMGKAQPPCPVRLARHGPATKTVMAGRGLTTTVKVTNTGRETVVVNVAIRLPDNVCASKDGVSPGLKKTSSPSRDGATVANQIVRWLEVPLNPSKSRSFKVKAQVSPTYATTMTSISASAYILDGQGNFICLSILADAPLSIRASKKAARPDTALNCTSRPPLSTVTFYKPSGAVWTDPQYIDKITDDVWLTRQDRGAVYNYKYYLDTYGRDATFQELYDDFWYQVPGAEGGTRGVLWGMLNDDWATPAQAPYVNPALFATIGNPTNFFPLKAMGGLFAIAHFQIGVPEYFDYASHEWRLVGGGSYYNTYMPAFAGPNLAIYIPADNSYCTFDFNHWGEANGGEIGWIRTCFYY